MRAARRPIAREGMASFMDTVYRSMRLVTSLYGVLYLLNSLLLFSVGALSIWLWLGRGGVHRRGRRRASAWCCASGACRNGSCGKCRRCSRTSARCRTASARSRCRAWSRTSRARRRSSSTRARSTSTGVGFHYGKEKGVIEDLSLDRPAGREGRHRRPLGRRQVDAGQPAAALLRPRERPHPHRRAGHRRGHAGQPARPDRHGDAGHLAAAPLGARQHPLWPSRRDRGR